MNGERCKPDMKPSTTARASSSSEPTRASSSGSRNRAGVVTGAAATGGCSLFLNLLARLGQIMRWLQSALRFGHRLNQPLDHLIRIDFLRLSLKIQQHAMSQHRRRHCAHVFTRNVVTSTQNRARLPPRSKTATRATIRPTSPTCSQSQAPRVPGRLALTNRTAYRATVSEAGTCLTSR